MPARFPIDRVASLLVVVAVHAAALYGLWAHRLIPTPLEAASLFVDFIAPPAPEKLEQPKRPPSPPKLQPRERPQSRQLIAETPVIAPTDYVAPPPPPKPVPVIEAPPMPLPAGPVTMASELSVACPERSAPPYPAQSRRLGETGIVVLRVELSETGHVAVAKVQSSSGYVRLDEAALAAVRTWRCTPSTRNGQAVRAVALQPFNFVLQ
ncbi:MAG: energy transducer TonB [Sulfuritalea sp.]|nr:energy transducer TonB [Sulfuritalea sp.]MBK8119078.1 energy transducer TonB [Sulfuritalea sp.]